MHIERITKKLGDKTKFMRWTYQSKAARGRYKPKQETLTQIRARNAREYKWYFGRVLTYPGFGRGWEIINHC